MSTISEVTPLISNKATVDRKERETQATALYELSVIIPAHQEEQRIQPTLINLIEYLSANFIKTQVIVVCNGCTDGTAEVARSVQSPENCTIDILNLSGSGKGRAVREGILAAEGEAVLFTDADAAFAPDLFKSFVDRLNCGADIVIAEREKTQKYNSALRRLLGEVTGLMLSTFVTPGVRDTQAGLKAFNRKAARRIFSQQRTNGFAFDIEVLMLAEKYHLRIEKLVVPWTDCGGSTVRLGRDYARALGALIKTYWRVKLSGH